MPELQNHPQQDTRKPDAIKYMIIDKKILGVCQIASKDVWRPALAGVRIHKGKVVATDGYSLIIAQLPDQSIEENLPAIDGQKYQKVDNALLNAQDLANVAKSIKHHNKLDALNHAWVVQADEGSVRFVTTDLAVNTQMDLPRVVADYPKYENLVDEAVARKKSHKITVNITKLKTMLDSFIKAGVDKEGMVELDVPDDRTKPLVLRAKDNKQKDLFGLIMAIRVAEDDEKSI